MSWPCTHISTPMVLSWLVGAYLRSLCRTDHAPVGIVQLPRPGQLALSSDWRVQTSQMWECGGEGESVEDLRDPSPGLMSLLLVSPVTSGQRVLQTISDSFGLNCKLQVEVLVCVCVCVCVYVQVQYTAACELLSWFKNPIITYLLPIHHHLPPIPSSPTSSPSSPTSYLIITYLLSHYHLPPTHHHLPPIPSSPTSSPSPPTSSPSSPTSSPSSPSSSPSSPTSYPIIT